MRSYFLFFTLLVCGFSFGQTAVYTVTSTSAATTSGTAPTGSSATYSQTYTTMATQITGGNSATLTLIGYAGYKITDIVLEMRSNSSSGAGNMSATAGSTTIASIATATFLSSSWNGAWSTTYVNITKTPSSYDIATGENVVITINATVNSLYIQKYTITYAPVTVTPTITATPATLTGFNYIVGNGPSGEQTFAVSGSNLTNDILVTAPTNYEVSTTSGGTFTNTVSLTPTLGTVSSTTIYTRLKASLAVATYNGVQVDLTSTGAATKTVDLSGSVTNLSAPNINSALTKTTSYGTAGSYNISATNGPNTYSTGVLPAGFSFSGNSISSASTTNAGNYTIAITATNGSGSDTKNLVWTITKQSLIVTGLAGVDRTYDGTNAATVIGTPTLVGVLFSDNVTLSGTPSINFTDKHAGINKTINISLYLLTGTKAPNYSLTLPTAQATILRKSLSITAPIIASKVYDGLTSTGSITTGTLSGMVGSETVIVSATGTFADPNAGTGKPAVVTYTLADGTNGGLAINYLLANSNSTGTITKAPPAFTVLPINIIVGGNYSLPGANIVSTSDGSLSYIITAGGAATLTGTTINGIAVGTETLTVSQAASTNYITGSIAVPVNVSLVSYVNGDFLSISGTGNYEDSSSWSRCSNVGGCTGTTIGAGGWAIPSTNRPNAGSTVYIKGTITLNNSLGVTKSTILNGGNLVVDAAHPVSNSMTIKSGGIVTVNGNLNFNNTSANFVIEDNADLVINYTTTNPNTSLWNGVEEFAANSNVIYNYGRTDKEIFNPESVISINPATNAKFGNLLIQPTLFSTASSNWTRIFPIGTYNLTNGDLVVNNSVDRNFTFNGGNITIGGDLNVNVTNSGEVATRSDAGTSIWNLDGDLNKSGSGMFRLNGGGNFTLNVNGDIKLNEGLFRTGVSISASNYTTVNLDGDLIASTFATIDSNNSNANNVNFNFTGLGDGLSSNTTQTIDVATTGINENKYIFFNVKSGAYVQLINRDFQLGTNSNFTVENGGVLDFGFNGSLPLNLVRVGTETGQSFAAQANSTLKITSPLGITNFGDYSGNVQVGATAINRVFDLAAIYHYIGKANQVSGSGLPDGAGGKTVIVELLNDGLQFWATPVTSVKRFNSSGKLEIRSGTVLDGTNPDNTLENYGRFSDALDASATPAQSGKLSMQGGRYIVYHSTTAAPNLSGDYDLTGGVIQFDGNNQSVRAPKDYLNVEITGVNVGTPGGNITLKNNGTFIIKPNGVFLINNYAIVGPAGTQSVTVEGLGVFSTGDVDGFNGGTGATTTSIRNDVENIILMPASTVNYSRDNPLQNITHFAPYYANLNVSGSGIKTLQSPTLTTVNENLDVVSGKLLVEVDKVITVNKAVKISTTSGEFEIENNGQLIQIDEVDTNVGVGNNFKVNRIAKVKNFDYVYWSASASGMDVSTLPNNNRYYWDPIYTNPNGTQGYWLPATGTMLRGRGYISRFSNASPTVPVATAVSLVGSTPFNGQFSTGISRGTTAGINDCLNLIGNPYPSALDADLFLAANPVIEGSVRIWMHGNSLAAIASPFYQNFTSNYTINDYIIYNGTAATVPAAFSGDIASGQGFFVRMLEAGETSGSSATATSSVNFKNSFRKAFDGSLLNNTEFYKTNTANVTSEKSRIWLDLISPDNTVSKIVVGYVAGATAAKDRLYDAVIDVSGFSFYSVCEDYPLAIQGRALPFEVTDSVPLGVVVQTAGAHTIAISSVDGLFSSDNQNIYVEDLVLGKTHNIKLSPYTFQTDAGTFNNRFVLKYTTESLSTNEVALQSNLAIAISENQVMLKASEEMANVKFYDMLGRLVYSSKINSTEFTTDAIQTNGVLVARIKFANGQTVDRKLML